MVQDATIQKKKFGTFIGVFLPSILTVLGLIMYLRFGWVVGNLGLGYTIVLVLVANIITFISGLSAAAIATNIEVGVGGVYYLISRSLGLETGGAIGIAFYISRTLSITFYCFGLAESMLLFWPVELWGAMPGYAGPALAAFFIIVITVVSGKSAELVLKFQVPMLILVGLSILALIVGVFMHDLRMPEWTPAYRSVNPDGGFWIVFAVFFPGVTGFLAGIAMSGDLKDPGRSISKGTIWSVVVGCLVYLLIPTLMAISAALPYDQMAEAEYGIRSWTQIAWMGGLFIYPAAWGAILSSAIGSVLSGPRVLQSLSQDGLAPKFLSRLSKTGQPTIATWITGGVALAAVLLGSLNTVAKFVTVLFLTLYVIINLVAAIEKLVAEPSYRPKVDIPWYVSLIGAAGAFYAMYLISPLALVLALGLEFACYLYFQKRSLEQQWGDVKAGVWLNAVRYSLMRLNQYDTRPRNWRPLMLLFVEDIKERLELVKLAAAFGQKKGVLSISKLVFDHSRPDPAQLRDTKVQMIEDIRDVGLEAFCEINVVGSLEEGIYNVAKSHGIGGLKTNTVIFGWSDDAEANRRQLKIIRRLSYVGTNIVLVRFNDHEAWKQPSQQYIDIWWSGMENNGDLMMILAYMLSLNPSWKNASIRVRSVVDTEKEREALKAGIEQSLDKAHIPASVNIVLRNGDSFSDILHRESADADIVFIGLADTEEDREGEHVQQLEKIGDVGKIVVFAQNNRLEGSYPILLNQRTA